MENFSEISQIIQNGGITAVLVFIVFQLQKVVKYLSEELKNEIKKNDEVIVKLYEKQITDLKEEYQSQFENRTKCKIHKKNADS